MFKKLRWWLMQQLGARKGTGILVGSYISVDGDHAVSIQLMDGWKEAAARLSPAGARRIAASLTAWADAAEKNNTQYQWKAVIKYAEKNAAGEVVEEGTVETSS